MFSNKIFTVVRRLFQMTQENKLEWQETGRDGVFQIVIDEYIVRVAEELGEDAKAVPKYVLRICNAKGIVLEQVSNLDISERMMDAEEFMHDLYQRARRTAMGAETALDRIILRLEADEAEVAS